MRPTDSGLLKQTHTVDVFRAESAQTDREALLALYNSAGGSGWTASDGWDSAQTLDTWHGVTLDGDGRVMGLALAGKQPERNRAGQSVHPHQADVA